MKILTFGSLNLDYVYQVAHFVRPGETLSATQQTMKPGGKGLNQSIALSRAGARVFHAGCVGQGGEGLKTLLWENGVDTEYLFSVSALQGNAVIQVNPQGENCILLFGGSNQCVTREQVNQTLGAFSAGDWLLLQNEVNLVDYMVEQAAEKGMMIALNPSPYDDKLASVDFQKLHWLLVNEIEAEQITGCGEPDAVWETLHKRFPKLSLLITLGKAGSIAWRVRGQEIEACCQATFPVQAVDTTAAGDTFTGYFINGIMKNEPLSACMERASRAAAIAVTRPGAAESIPCKEEVEASIHE